MSASLLTDITYVNWDRCLYQHENPSGMVGCELQIPCQTTQTVLVTMESICTVRYNIVTEIEEKDYLRVRVYLG